MARYPEHQQPSAPQGEPTSYTFRVDSCNEIDYPRILKENKGADAVLVSIPHDIPVLYLSRAFRNKFSDYGPPVAGQDLGPYWGVRCLNEDMGDWHWKFADNTKVLRQEIKAARAYKNAITVSVEIL
jgi:hypothetical protein